MKTAILYASSRGTVEWCARKIAEMLGEQTVMIDLKREKLPDLEAFDTVVLGGSIHAGQLQGKVRKLIKNREAELGNKQLGLFLCSMEKSSEQFDASYPLSLREAATATGVFGGRMIPEQMNGFIRMVVKKVSGSIEPRDTVDTDAIARFAEQLKP